MAEDIRVAEAVKEQTTAYFDLEFCNEINSRHNVPIAVGISYRKGGRELSCYSSQIWFGEECNLWEEQLAHIGYEKKTLQTYGKPMEEITGDLLAAHRRYRPVLYISFGRQDEELLKRFATQSLSDFQFYDVLRYLSASLSLKYDISLEKYAYICGIDFVHDFDPLEDSRVLADVLGCVLRGGADKARMQEVTEEYDRKMFLAEYKNKRQACEYLQGLENRLTPAQRVKLRGYEDYLAENKEKYLEYFSLSGK